MLRQMRQALLHGMHHILLHKDPADEPPSTSRRPLGSPRAQERAEEDARAASLAEVATERVDVRAAIAAARERALHGPRP
jgi:hypothetical protein